MLYFTYSNSDNCYKAIVFRMRRLPRAVMQLVEYTVLKQTSNIYNLLGLIERWQDTSVIATGTSQGNGCKKNNHLTFYLSHMNTNFRWIVECFWLY